MIAIYLLEDQMKKDYRWVVIIIFAVLALLFFNKLFSGYTFNAGDGNIASIKSASNYIPSSSAAWSTDHWMGDKIINAVTDPFFMLMNLFKDNKALATGLSYLVTVFLSLIFSYLFLRKIRLSILSSVFGSIIYGFTPVFLSLIYSGHNTVINILEYLPAILFFLTILFDSEEADKFKKITAILISGIAWGLMVSSDQQRGLYFSIVSGVYAILLIIRNCKPVNISGLLKKRFFVDLAKLILVLFVSLLCFINIASSVFNSIFQRSAIQGGVNNTGITRTEQEKWDFSTSFSQDPAELIENLSFGFFGGVSGDQDAPYWGSRAHSTVGEFRGNSNVIGFFAVLFMMIGIIAYYRKNFFLKFFFWAGAAALLLSFGKFFPGSPFFWLWYHLPYVNAMRTPDKFVSVTAFAAAVLAAFGFESLFAEEDLEKVKYDNRIKYSIIGLSVIAGIGVIALFITLLMSTDIADAIGGILQSPDQGIKAAANINLAILRMIVLTALSIIAFVILIKYYKNKNVKTGVGIFFILAALIDIWSINGYYMDKSYAKEYEFYKPDGVITELKNDYMDEIFRVADAFYVNFSNQAGPIQLTALKGYYMTYMFPYFKIEPMDVTATSSLDIEYNNFFISCLAGSSLSNSRITSSAGLINSNLRLFELANIKYLITDGNLYLPGQQPYPIYMDLTNNSNFSLKTIVNGYNRPQAIFENKNYLPRLGFYENYSAVNNDSEELSYISNYYFDFRKSLVVEANMQSHTNSTNTVAAQKISAYNTWSLKSDVIAPEDGFLLLTTRYNKDWKAMVDGKEAPVYKANYLEMAVKIDKGTHSVYLYYDPDRTTFYISLITVIAGLVLLIIYGIKYIYSTIKNK